MAQTIICSWSEIDTFRQCPFKHELAYKQRWQQEPREGGALARGSRWHNVMETHYLYLKECQNEKGKVPSIFNPAELLRRQHEWLYDDSGRQTEDMELIEWMYEGYLLQYGLDPDWKVVAVEHPCEFWLPTPRGGRSRFKLKTKIDCVMKHLPTGRLYVWDHKSGRNLPNQKMLEMNDQFGLYLWGLRQMGKKVYGALHSAARTQRNKDSSLEKQPLDSRFQRTPIYRTDKELSMIAVEAYKSMTRAYGVPLGQAERNTNEDTCSWRCDYTEACLISRQGRPIEPTLRGMDFEQNFERH